MGSSKVVFDKPFRKARVEYLGIRVEISMGYELILQGAVESLILWVILGSFDPGPVLLDA